MTNFTIHTQFLRIDFCWKYPLKSIGRLMYLLCYNSLPKNVQCTFTVYTLNFGMKLINCLFIQIQKTR